MKFPFVFAFVARASENTYEERLKKGKSLYCEQFARIYAR